MSKLIPFDDYVIEKLYNLRTDPHDLEDLPSGIMCPKCGKELRIDKSMILTSNPPKYRVWCSAAVSNCTFTGYVPV